MEILPNDGTDGSSTRDGAKDEERKGPTKDRTRCESKHSDGSGDGLGGDSSDMIGGKMSVQCAANNVTISHRRPKSSSLSQKLLGLDAFDVNE